MKAEMAYADSIDVTEFDPGFQIWWALMLDVWEQNWEEGMDILIGHVAKVLAQSERDRLVGTA